jgi:hypothetical protein
MAGYTLQCGSARENEWLGADEGRDVLAMVRHRKVFVVPFQFFPVRHGECRLVDKRGGEARGKGGLYDVSSDSDYRCA